MIFIEVHIDQAQKWCRFNGVDLHLHQENSDYKIMGLAMLRQSQPHYTSIIMAVLTNLYRLQCQQRSLFVP